MGCSVSLSTLRHVLFGVLLASFNFVSSLINIYYLFKEEQVLFGILDLFLLWFPGTVTCLFLSVIYSLSRPDCVCGPDLSTEQGRESGQGAPHQVLAGDRLHPRVLPPGLHRPDHRLPGHRE